jgi:hypothetical protein
LGKEKEREREKEKRKRAGIGGFWMGNVKRET